MAGRIATGIDTLIIGARVHRVPGEVAGADAVAIAEGTIAAVGDSASLREITGPATTIVEAGGLTLLPAFIDSHSHFHRGAVLQRLYLDFETLQVRDVADVLDRVRERAAGLAHGEWVQGDSLSAARLAEGRLPDRGELDAASPQHPVVLRGIGKHVVAANSAALTAAGIDRDTPDPPGGRIERDDRGEPTGILHERAKLRLDQSHPETTVPRPTPSDRRAALRDGFRELHRAGITTIHEMIRLTEEADDYAVLRAVGELGVRVRFYYRVHESPIALDWLVGLGIRRGLGDDWLRILGVKVSVDGFCIFRNAAVNVPYRGQPDNLGMLRIEPDQLADIVATANRQGLNVAVHAVGVRAVDHALEAFAAAGPAVAGPHRLEHGYVDIDGARIERARRLGLVWSVQPAFAVAYDREWTEAFGPERRDRVMPLRAGRDAGLTILFNSDFPCVPLDPLTGIRAAAARGVSVADAWRAYSTTPAQVACDDRLGRVETGALADLVLVAGDPFGSEADLDSVAVRATMIAGRMVHDDRQGGG